MRPGTAIALVALFLAVAGGSAVALKGHDTVRSDDIVDGQVKAADLAPTKAKAVKPNPVGDNDPCASHKSGVFCGAGSPSGLRGWSNLGAGFADVTYSRDDLGLVRLEGTMIRSASPVVSSQSFTLPKGYRPAATREFAVAIGQQTNCSGVACDPNLAVIRIDPNGDVTALPGSDTGSYTAFANGVSVDGVAFSAK